MLTATADRTVYDDAIVSGTKVVAIGDPRQLPAIEAGGMFAALANRLGAVELAENLRQDERWEHLALEERRAGDVVRGVLAYLDHDRVHSAEAAPDLVRRLIDDWHQLSTNGQELCVVVRRP